MTKTKKETIRIVVLVSVLTLLLFNLVGAQEVDPFPYLYDAAVPKQQNLEVKDNLLVNLFSGGSYI
jgi:hypothetical protein